MHRRANVIHLLRLFLLVRVRSQLGDPLLPGGPIAWNPATGAVAPESGDNAETRSCGGGGDATRAREPSYPPPRPEPDLEATEARHALPRRIKA